MPSDGQRCNLTGCFIGERWDKRRGCESDTGEGGGRRVKTRNNFPAHNTGRLLPEELFHYALDKYLRSTQPTQRRQTPPNDTYEHMWVKVKGHLGTGHEEQEGE